MCMPRTSSIDVLAHLAWPGLPNYQALFHFEHNLFADYRFIKQMVEAGVSQVLVTGTCFEYGMQSGPLGETAPPQPGNPYGLAKNTLRLFLETLRQQLPFNLQWARLFYLYGEGQNPNSLLASLDRAIDAGAERFDMSAGEQLRDYLPIEVAAGYLARLLEQRGFQLCQRPTYSGQDTGRTAPARAWCVDCPEPGALWLSQSRAHGVLGRGGSAAAVAGGRTWRMSVIGQVVCRCAG